MLSLERCRQLLGAKGVDLSDERVLQLRDTLYGLAHFLVDKYIQEHTPNMSSSPTSPKGNPYEL